MVTKNHHFLISTVCILPKSCKYNASTLTRDHNIPTRSNYFQTFRSQNYTYAQKPVWPVMFDLPLLTLSACFYLSIPSGSPLSVWQPEGQLHSEAYCTCTKLTHIQSKLCSVTQRTFSHYETLQENVSLRSTRVFFLQVRDVISRTFQILNIYFLRRCNL